ncbi:MAG: alanine--tRNA ligase [Candidatus Kapaibacterium sp.]
MTSQEIRQSFLDYFSAKEHRIVPSAPVVPHGDPTLLFTNAGMNQFKDIFLAIRQPEYSRAADTQKCIRVSGKHNDLEEVGRDTYHHTFFEMLGNWSFGDYYKPEAIEWAWELLTKVWKLDPERLHATVFRTDDEAYELWKSYLPESRIHRFDEKDNFWEMGETGPCGPCSEIHYDRTPDLSGGPLVNAGQPEVIEIWNLVFIQYNRKANGQLEDLRDKHVDTGMGFERICSVIQGVDSNYDTDVFMPVISEMENLSGRKYSRDLSHPDGTAMRVCADHIRTLSFAIADGALPGNEGRGYVLRRILRRGSRYARNLGFREPVLHKLVKVLVETMGDMFPELVQQQAAIEKVVRAEEESFLVTLDRGLDKFENIRKDLEASGKTTIPGAEAFQLYDTFGFPVDLTELLARENGLAVDRAGFDEHMAEQKRRSREARKVKSQEVELPEITESSEFIGYDTLSAEGRVLYIKENQVVLDKTPFYAESGGQVADTGTITLGGEKYSVTDVRKSGNAIVHICDRDLEDLTGATAYAEVDEQRRRAIMRNHSATHLLHEALRNVLGTHVQQSGSLVAPDYLRFDFNHFEKVTNDELRRIEAMANRKILENHKISTEVLALDEARKNPKVKMFFGDKYGETVRVISMDPQFSQELCGGTHVSNTSEIGFLKITSESSIAAGVRRIEAITGERVEEYIYGLIDKIAEKDHEASTLYEKIRKLEKQIQSLKMDEVKGEMSDWIDSAREVGGIRVIARQIEAEGVDEMRNIAENLRIQLKENGVALLAVTKDDKVQLICTVTDDLKKKLPAGKLVGAAAKKIGGGGGGKPHMATAGGKDADKLGDLLDEFPALVEEMAS